MEEKKETSKVKEDLKEEGEITEEMIAAMMIEMEEEIEEIEAKEEKIDQTEGKDKTDLKDLKEGREEKEIKSERGEIEPKIEEPETMIEEIGNKDMRKKSIEKEDIKEEIKKRIDRKNIAPDITTIEMREETIKIVKLFLFRF